MTITLDPSKDPKHIDMAFPDGPNAPKIGKGIYKIDGDTFTMCRAFNPGQSRPRDFATQPDTNTFLVVWKKQEK